jgi:hypothetical protein
MKKTNYNPKNTFKLRTNVKAGPRPLRKVAHDDGLDPDTP